MEAKPYAYIETVRLPAPPAFNPFCDLNLHAFPIETDKGPPAPPAFNPFCDLDLHAFPIETDEGPPAPAFDPFRDLDLHASKRPAVPAAADNPPICYTGANAFKNKDWHKG